LRKISSIDGEGGEKKTLPSNRRVGTSQLSAEKRSIKVGKQLEGSRGGDKTTCGYLGTRRGKAEQKGNI